MNTKKLFAASAISVALFWGATTVSAQTATSTPDITALQAQVAQLLQQVTQLQAQLAELQKTNASLQGNVEQLKQTLQITTQLRKGMSGDDVKHLQEVLATDPNLFSKDNVTGYYGPLTEKAVEHFQEHFGITVVGMVGPLTLEKINEILKEHNATSTEALSENELGDLGENSGMVGGEDKRRGEDMMSSTTPSGEDMMSSTTSEGESGKRKHEGE